MNDAYPAMRPLTQFMGCTPNRECTARTNFQTRYRGVNYHSSLEKSTKEQSCSLSESQAKVMYKIGEAECYGNKGKS